MKSVSSSSLGLKEALILWTLLSLDSVSVAYQFTNNHNPQLRPYGWGSTISLQLLKYQQQTPKQIDRARSKLSMVTLSSDVQAEQMDGESEDDQDALVVDSEDDEVVDTPHGDFQFSKSKWKKKRFLMMKDVNAAVHKRNPKAASKAEQMVRRMWALYEKTGEADFRPDLQVYNLWIHAVAKSRPQKRNNKSRSKDHSVASASEEIPPGKRAENILQEMRDKGVLPNVVSYTSVMDAYANQGRWGDSKAPAEAERVLFDLLERSEYSSNLQVTAVTSDAVLNAWAQQGTWESAERAQQILERLEAMTMTASKSSTGVAKQVRPTAHSYATVINAWAKSGGGAEAAKRAQAILDRLLTERKQQSDEDAVKPDTVIFNAVIGAWASSGDPQCGSKATELLRQMKDLDHGLYCDNCQPDVVTYNSILSAWSRSGHINAATQAEKILKDMIVARKEDPESNPAPNVISYNTVLHAWSKSSLEGAAERAETLLKYMARSEQGDIVPDVYSYSTVLDAIAKSKQPGKALRAKKLLEHMLESPEMKPEKLTPVPFNAVINAAAFSAVGTCDEERREALEVAVSIFPLMTKAGVDKDTISYGNLLKALANLMAAGDKRYEMALRLFVDCCDKGLVEDLVWNEVQRCVPFYMLSDHLALGSSTPGRTRLRDLPRHWRRNRRMKSQRRRQINNEGTNNAASNKSEPPENKELTPLRRQVVIAEPSWESGHDV